MQGREDYLQLREFSDVQLAASFASSVLRFIAAQFAPAQQSTWSVRGVFNRSKQLALESVELLSNFVLCFSYMLPGGLRNYALYQNQKSCSILLLGRSGVGKSSSINTMFGKPVCKVGSGESVTKRTVKYRVKVCTLYIMIQPLRLTKILSLVL